jgi:hypothetical protein
MSEQHELTELDTTNDDTKKPLFSSTSSSEETTANVELEDKTDVREKWSCKAEFSYAFFLRLLRLVREYMAFPLFLL